MMTPGKGGRSPAGASEATDDFPLEGDNPKRPASGSFALQTVMEMQKTLGALCERIDGLVESRKEDKADYKKDTDKLETSIKEAAAKAESGFKDFIKEDFRPLRDDVLKLRLKWAWVTGLAAAVGVLASFLLDLAKKKWGLG